MGHQGQLIPLQFTPRASISARDFYEIDWSIQFCPPRRRAKNFAHSVVDLHEGTRWNKGIHRVVSEADVSIQTVPDVQMAYDRDGHLAPDSYHPREQGCFL